MLRCRSPEQLSSPQSHLSYSSLTGREIAPAVNRDLKGIRNEKDSCRSLWLGNAGKLDVGICRIGQRKAR